MYFKSLPLATLDDATSFIRRNGVSFTREGGSLKATFSLKASQIFRYVLSSVPSVDQSIRRTVTIDESEALPTQYEYNFKDVYAAMLEQEKESTKYFHSSMDSFVIRGKELDMPAEELKLEGTFTEYAPEQASDFMTQVQEHVIPRPAKR